MPPKGPGSAAQWANGLGDFVLHPWSKNSPVQSAANSLLLRPQGRFQAGGYDYLVKFMTGGISEYQSIMERLVEMEIGIDKYFSFVILKSPIVKSHLPLDSFVADD